MKLSNAIAHIVILSLALISANVRAENYPSKPIKIVVPFAAGGTTDILARVIGQELTKAWGQQVIVDNRAGAGGNIGS
ncbi:MAG: tripartite tricarboxylate transporter substrate-binding protein, partial [Burkholderiales bacterium]